MTSSRRQFVATLAGCGLGSTLLPGILWAQATASGTAVAALTVEQVGAAAALAGLDFSTEQCAAVVEALQQNLPRYAALHDLSIPNDVAPPFYFSPVTSGMVVDRTAAPIRFSERTPRPVPTDLEELAFWPLLDLAALLRARRVSSEALTRMYLARLHRLNTKLNCVVTFLDEPALAEARAADAEIAAGRYRGPLHGMPWGCKDIIAAVGAPTTWGSPAFQEQTFAEDATVVKLLRGAGAVLLAKLSTGELAGGDVWFGGRTNNPWNLDQGSSGSSAGSASATSAGCVPFALGTETSGSIFSPSSRCGATGLRPTFGRVSRHGAMALSWTMDRIGPICRHVEDCAAVMAVLCQRDDLDLAMPDVPFNWDASRDWRGLRIGYLVEAFADTDRHPDWLANDAATLATMKELGATLVPVHAPEVAGFEALSLSVESAVFFDELTRSGRDALLAVKTRGQRMRASRFIPAVEYLQSQRVRAMMMAQLAAATAHVDVYLAPYGTGLPRPEPGAPQPPPNATARHTTMANLATYPGVALPNGFAADGTPTSITFMGRPFGEAAVLAVAKAYQDAAPHNLRQPPL